jgi:hypothetical protein
MRSMAFLALMASAFYAGLVVVPDFLGANLAAIFDPLLTIVRLYVVAIFLLSIAILQKSARTRRSQLTIRGILEGALVAYALCGAYYVLQAPQHDTDGAFHRTALYVGLALLGPLLSGLGAAVHLLAPRHPLHE